MAKDTIKCISAAIVLLLCYGSCASGAKSRDDRLHAYLTNTSKYILQSTGGIEQSMDMPQRVTASFQDMDLSLVAWVKADETVIDVTMLNEMGTNIGELSYSDDAISFSSEVFPGSIQPEYIVADFQLCYYNAVLIARALKDCGLSMEISGTTRRIFKGNELIYEIIKNADAVILTNYLRGYTYTLEGDFN